MFSAVVLVLGCLLQMKLVTTEGHRGTNRHVFYAVQMDGGISAARALAEQHGLEFIQQVGSLEGLYTLRDSRGRNDRATFENRLSTTLGLCVPAPSDITSCPPPSPPSTSLSASPSERTMQPPHRAFVARETVTHGDIP